MTATTEAGETYAEVAHEAIFRRWNKLREWITAEREFLVWRTGLEAARRAWETTPNKLKHEAVLTGLALTQAARWLASRGEDLTDTQREFVERSKKMQKTRLQQAVGMFSMFLFCALFALFAYISYDFGISAMQLSAMQRVAAAILAVIPVLTSSGCGIGIYFNSRVAACLGWSVTAIYPIWISVEVFKQGEADLGFWLGILVTMILLLLGGAVGVRATFLNRDYKIRSQVKSKTSAAILR